MLSFKRQQAYEPIYYYSFNTDIKGDDLLHYTYKIFKLQILVVTAWTYKVFLAKFIYYFLYVNNWRKTVLKGYYVYLLFNFKGSA